MKLIRKSILKKCEDKIIQNCLITKNIFQIPEE